MCTKSPYVSFELLFLDKPRIIRTPHEVIYYEAGKVFSKNCYVTGYPLPDVKWIFKKCPNYPDCEEAYQNVSVIFFQYILFIIYMVLFILFCSKYLKFLVSECSKGFIDFKWFWILSEARKLLVLQKILFYNDFCFLKFFFYVCHV